MNEGLSDTFAALGDPTRLAIVTRLMEGEADVGALAKPFEMTQPAISHHIRVLETAGLIERRRVGTRRPCRIAPGKIEEIDRWLAQFRDAMEQNYTRLDALLGKDTP